jgi:YesN/AraC family two-component response regulator
LTAPHRRGTIPAMCADSAGRKRLLFVDDGVNLLGMQAIFRREYDVLTAASAREGLDIIESSKVDVVVSDQRMPGMKGTELFAAIVARGFTGTRILLTGYESDEEIRNALRTKVIDAVLSKPLDQGLLIDWIEGRKAAGT